MPKCAVCGEQSLDVSEDSAVENLCLQCWYWQQTIFMTPIIIDLSEGS